MTSMGVSEKDIRKRMLEAIQQGDVAMVRALVPEVGPLRRAVDGVNIYGVARSIKGKGKNREIIMRIINDENQRKKGKKVITKPKKLKKTKKSKTKNMARVEVLGAREEVVRAWREQNLLPDLHLSARNAQLWSDKVLRERDEAKEGVGVGSGPSSGGNEAQHIKVEPKEEAEEENQNKLQNSEYFETMRTVETDKQVKIENKIKLEKIEDVNIKVETLEEGTHVVDKFDLAVAALERELGEKLIRIDDIKKAKTSMADIKANIEITKQKLTTENVELMQKRVKLKNKKAKNKAMMAVNKMKREVLLARVDKSYSLKYRVFSNYHINNR